MSTQTCAKCGNGFVGTVLDKKCLNCQVEDYAEKHGITFEEAMERYENPDGKRWS